MITDYSDLVGLKHGTSDLPLAPLIGKEPLPSADGNSVALRAFLPDSGVVPAEFVPSCSLYGRTGRGAHPQESSLTFGQTTARRSFTPDGESMRPTDVISARVRLLDRSARTARVREACHEADLWAEFGGEPSYEHATGWVETHLEERRVEGFRRTELANRVPIHSFNEIDDRSRQKPVRRFAVVFQTTPWGLLGVGARLTTTETDSEALQIVREITDECLDRILGTDARIEPSAYEGRADMGVQDTPPTTIPWEEMTATERERVVLAGLEALGDGSGVGLDALQGLFDERYRASEADVRATVERLVDRGTLEEPSETVLLRPTLL